MTHEYDSWYNQGRDDQAAIYHYNGFQVMYFAAVPPITEPAMIHWHNIFQAYLARDAEQAIRELNHAHEN